jgi:hypothetical protein
MMGRLNHDQAQLFYSFSLEKIVPEDHLVMWRVRLRSVCYVRSITGVAAENAELLLFALGPAGFFRLWPRGARRTDIEDHFSASWSIIWTSED